MISRGQVSFEDLGHVFEGVVGEGDVDVLYVFD